MTRYTPAIAELTPEQHAAIWEPHKTAMSAPAAAPRRRPEAPVRPATPNAPVATSVSTEPTAPATLASSTLTARWEQAVTRHLSVTDAYAALLTDPLTALTHAALWDLTNPRSAAFTLAYAEICDIRDLHPHTPTDEALVAEYAGKVRHTQMVWVDALHHAEQLGYTWLEAAEAAKARRAERLLRQATDLSATDAERALAADKARTLIADIKGMRLPADVRVAIDTAARRSLPPA